MVGGVRLRLEIRLGTVREGRAAYLRWLTLQIPGLARARYLTLSSRQSHSVSHNRSSQYFDCLYFVVFVVSVLLCSVPCDAASGHKYLSPC